ncbi:MAG: deacylase [Chitinivibrionales bacterium]|nr:deacylase [Chitinivibrionales bacterium]MBD3356698.1 deacylase [Chitinivibrionales bacterium]
MMVRRLKEYFDGNDVKYTTFPHHEAFTAQEIAAAADMPGGMLAKTVMVKLDGKPAMAVLPASHVIDFDRLREVADVNEAELAPEEEYTDVFPDCERGAMPPFGNLYGLDVYLARSLTEGPEMAFNAGSLKELVKISTANYLRLVEPRTASYTFKEHGERRRERPVRA